MMPWNLLMVAMLGMVIGTAGIAKADLSVVYIGSVIGDNFVDLPAFNPSTINDAVLTDVRYAFSFGAGTTLQANDLNGVMTNQETTLTVTWNYTILGGGHILASGSSTPVIRNVTVPYGISGLEIGIPNAGSAGSGGIDLGPNGGGGGVSIRGSFSVTSSNPLVSAFTNDDAVVGSASVTYSYVIGPEPSTIVPALTGVLLVGGYLWRSRLARV
jgi:hypothetical protein